MNYLQITIPADEPLVQEILIARLESAGYEGFEEQPAGLQAFIPADNFQEPVLREILEPFQLSWTSAVLEDKNWNEAWEKEFQPVIVDDFCAIRASFHPPVGTVTHEILITPKMSFGTGHHATTYMMIQAMRSLDFTGKTVLDFGTGTGVLAILAERLGAKDILAGDNDDWAVGNALENVRENHGRNIHVHKLDAIPQGSPYDIILANVNRQVILQELPAMRQQLVRGGVILLSGLLETDVEIIEKETVKLELPISRRLTGSGWICLTITKEDN